MNRNVSLVLMVFIIFTNLLAQKTKEEKTELSKPKITFVELGSVNCIPCKKMQPVMKSIESKYDGIVNVIFYDVWTDDGKPYSKKYGIKLIPTQVFLDENGKEFFRHEGFYPEKEIEKLLLSKGIKPIAPKG